MPRQYSYAENVFTDKIEPVGTVRRVFFRALLVYWDDATQSEIKEWHYFGSPLASYPLTLYPEFQRGFPVKEHNYISFPQDFDQLGGEANDVYYQMGLLAGLKRESLR